MPDGEEETNNERASGRAENEGIDRQIDPLMYPKLAKKFALLRDRRRLTATHPPSLVLGVPDVTTTLSEGKSRSCLSNNLS